jgi:hypothetical protein
MVENGDRTQGAEAMSEQLTDAELDALERDFDPPTRCDACDAILATNEDGTPYCPVNVMHDWGNYNVAAHKAIRELRARRAADDAVSKLQRSALRISAFAEGNHRGYRVSAEDMQSLDAALSRFPAAPKEPTT